MRADIEIARAAKLRAMADVAAEIGVPASALHPYGHHIAKVDAGFIAGLSGRPQGKLVLVTAISPTPAGEGKTTTTVGLGDGLRALGAKTAICLREPSLGPSFGMKGGAAGGGMAQIVPMEQINLHFTGDFHAITSAHNLLAALIDNHLHWGNKLGLDPRRITWRRALDMNDRALRDIVLGLGGPANGLPREGGFDITVASEVMAVFCLARDLGELEARLGAMVIGYTHDGRAVSAQDLDAAGAMTVLLKDALQPNLVQSLGGTPAFVHGGPFANIAHGCNSLVATSAALRLADYVITEAGFGADLGAEKFFDIKCRKGGLAPDAVVLVATIRALKMHGGVARSDLGAENIAALQDGTVNLARHLANLQQFGVPVVVAINHFATDTAAEHACLKEICAGLGVAAHTCRHWAEGGVGALDLAKVVKTLADSGAAKFQPLYGDDLPLIEKLRHIARTIYGAADIEVSTRLQQQFADLQQRGYGHLPVCVAKTQYSFSADPDRRGAPQGHIVPLRELRLAAGAGFVVAICGDIMTMPGLPREPAAARIRVNAQGEVEGLF